MRRRLALLCLLSATGTMAADVSATLVDGRLGASVNALAYPSTLQKELTSGLTNRLYAQVSLSDGRAVLTQKVVEFAIRYDLWDEKFTVTTGLEGTTADVQEFKDISELNAALAKLTMPGLFDIAALPVADELTLRVQVLLNPIDREKMRMIRKWVAQNSTPETSGDQGTSVSNTIFNRIFEQYADGSTVAAAWREQASSAPFRLNQLEHEGQ